MCLWAYLTVSPMCTLRCQIKWGRTFVQICLAQCLPLQYSPSSLLFSCPFIWFFSVAPYWSVPPCIKTDALITGNHQQTTSAVAWSSAFKAQRRLTPYFCCCSYFCSSLPLQKLLQILKPWAMALQSSSSQVPMMPPAGCSPCCRWHPLHGWPTRSKKAEQVKGHVELYPSGMTQLMVFWSSSRD